MSNAWVVRARAVNIASADDVCNHALGLPRYVQIEGCTGPASEQIYVQMPVDADGHARHPPQFFHGHHTGHKTQPSYDEILSSDGGESRAQTSRADPDAHTACKRPVGQTDT